MNIYTLTGFDALRFLPGLLTGIPTLVVWALSYAFTAISLYTMADRRGIRNAWLAWVPIANRWVLGSISDQYRYVVKREVRFKRRTLLILTIVPSVISVVILGIVGWLTGYVIVGTMSGATYYQMLRGITNPIATASILLLPLLGCRIAERVVYYMALYDVFASCDPENRILYLLLGIFFKITRPVFLFICREKELGMPPRRVQQANPESEIEYL